MNPRCKSKKNYYALNGCKKVTIEKRKQGSEKENKEIKENRSTNRNRKSGTKKKKKGKERQKTKKDVKMKQDKKKKKRRKEKKKKKKLMKKKKVPVANLKINEIASMIVKNRRKYLRNMNKKKNKKY